MATVYVPDFEGRVQAGGVAGKQLVAAGVVGREEHAGLVVVADLDAHVEQHVGLVDQPDEMVVAVQLARVHVVLQVLLGELEAAETQQECLQQAKRP